MKVASFNVNSIRARLSVVLEWLGENQPDVLCVQETKVQDVDFPKEAFNDTGYEFVFRGQKSYNGVAIFSRGKVEHVRYGFDDEPKDEARLIKAEVEGVSIINTYVPQGYMPESEKFDYKLNWFARLKHFFEKHFNPADSVIWMGDLNIAPDNIDVYDPDGLLGHVCFHPKVHAALQDVMNWGFVDIFRKHCKDAGQYSFWDYRMRNSFKNNFGWRLDHIMATKSLADESTACYIDKKPRTTERPSDHTPVIAEFNV